MEMIETLWYWMYERQEIYKRRKAGRPQPWTNDWILGTYRFCNVFRELDKTTEYIRDYWRRDDPMVWFAMCVARYINRIEALQDIDVNEIYNGNLEQAYAAMKSRQRDGLRVFTSAYMITNSGSTKSKIDYVFDDVLSPLLEDAEVISRRIKVANTLEEMYNVLHQYAGFRGGGFMAYEVVTDLRWTFLGKGASDIDSWSNAGPGARRGLNRLHDRPLRFRIRVDQTLEEMIDVLHLARRRGMEELLGQKLELRDIEHSLCEFDKYCRVHNGEGRPRCTL